MSPSTPAIELVALRKSFGRTEALRGLRTEVPVNSVFGFLGPNGAGKTTTMKILMGLLRPTSGSARVLGLDVERDSLEVRRRVGYLPQHPAYPEHLTAAGVLGLAARLRGVEDRTGDLLATAGLTDKADRRVGALSGGEAQRLGIAQALVGNPEVLILDEPSAGLDPEGRREVFGLLDVLRQQATVFYSTHLLDDVARLSDTIAVLARGEIVADGPIETFTIGASAATWRVRLVGSTRRRPSRRSGATMGRPRRPVGARRHRDAHHRPGARRTRAPARTDRGGGRVAEFRPTRRSLEDIYLELVGEHGEDHEGREARADG